MEVIPLTDAQIARLEKKQAMDETLKPGLGNVEQSLEELRNAGLDAWDKVEDPEVLIRELRGG